MTDITLTDIQAAGVKKIVDWYKNDTQNQQVFRVFGFAGVGKSTIVKYALEELGLSIGSASGEHHALAATFTGKAARVLTKKGTPCQTIHSLIYSVHEANEDQVKDKKNQLNKLAVDLMNAPPDMTDSLNAQLGKLKRELKDMIRPQFSLNAESILRDADLLILDEVSMVNNIMAQDLLSFEKPILVLGDPGQLPPIKGEGFFINAKPDVFLDEIHRQALESPIIRLSMMARQGKMIPFGEYSDDVMKLPRNSISAKDMLRADQVIAGYNATRLMLNSAMLHAAGYDKWHPTGKGEKLICLKNMNDIGLINGMFLTFEDCGDVLDGPGGVPTMRATIKTDDDVEIGEKTVYLGHFQDHVKLDKERDFNDRFHKKGLVEATFGYAITVHKSQSSGWNKIIFYDDGFGRSADDRKKFLYTAITRAEEGLVILA